MPGVAPEGRDPAAVILRGCHWASWNHSCAAGWLLPAIRRSCVPGGATERPECSHIFLRFSDRRHAGVDSVDTGVVVMKPEQVLSPSGDLKEKRLSFVVTGFCPHPSDVTLCFSTPRASLSPPYNKDLRGKTISVGVDTIIELWKQDFCPVVPHVFRGQRLALASWLPPQTSEVWIPLVPAPPRRCTDNSWKTGVNSVHEGLLDF